MKEKVSRQQAMI